MTYFIKNNGEVMTAQERLEQHPDGKCPLCFQNLGWECAVVVDEDEVEYVVECVNCNTVFPVKE